MLPHGVIEEKREDNASDGHDIARSASIGKNIVRRRTTKVMKDIDVYDIDKNSFMKDSFD